MKIGILVDGQAEYRSLPALLKKIETPNQLLDPFYVDIQPYASSPQIVTVVQTKLVLLRAKQAQMVIILIDREKRSDCSGAWAEEITQAMNIKYDQMGVGRIQVVIKNSCYENWLLSDPSIFEKMPKRFVVKAKQLSSIRPNQADLIDAQALLKSAAQSESYSKVADAVKITALANPLLMAQNSRSFRKMLREIGNPTYANQSIRPATQESLV